MVRPVRATRRRAPGRLVHLPEDHHRLVDDAGLLHLDVEVVALAGPLADAAEGREAAVLGGDVVDQLLDQHGLADAGAAEQADLAALGVGREQVDDLDAGLEDLLGRGQVLGARGGAVDRPAVLALDRLALVDRLAEQVEDATERVLADRDGDRGAGVDDRVAAAQAVGGVHRDRADAVVAEVLLDLEGEVDRVAAVALGHLDLQRRVDLGQLFGKTTSTTTPTTCSTAVAASLEASPLSRACRSPLTQSGASCDVSRARSRQFRFSLFKSVLKLVA